MTFFFNPMAVEGNGIHNQRFLSPEFLEGFAYAARRCRELGLRFSVAGGTGWPFGGPAVTTGDAAQRLRRLVLPVATNGVPQPPVLGEGEQVVAVFKGTNRISRRSLTDGSWNSRAGGPEPVTVYVAGPTRMRVKRPALGGEGWVASTSYNGLQRVRSPSASLW
jgi:hypothetical protein